MIEQYIARQKSSNKKQQMHSTDSINIAYAGHNIIPEGQSSHANAHYSNANRVIETDQKSMETYCNEYLEFPRPQLMNNLQVLIVITTFSLQ